MTDSATLTDLTGSGFKARTASGEPIVFALMAGAAVLTIGERSVEVPLGIDGLRALKDVAADKHARACTAAAVAQGRVPADEEPRVPRRTGMPEMASAWP